MIPSQCSETKILTTPIVKIISKFTFMSMCLDFEFVKHSLVLIIFKFSIQFGNFKWRYYLKIAKTFERISFDMCFTASTNNMKTILSSKIILPSCDLVGHSKCLWFKAFTKYMKSFNLNLSVIFFVVII